MKTCISSLEKIERQKFKYYKELKLNQDTYVSFIDSDFEWACDNCLETKNAVLAIPGLQETPWTPHLAYSDTKLNCSSCYKEFLFKKEEKKLWYETYKLPIKAEPNNCLACRRKIRNHNLENKTISEILNKTEGEITDKELEKVHGLLPFQQIPDQTAATIGQSRTISAGSDAPVNNKS